MGRYVIDAATLVHIVAEQLPVEPAHQLVAPNSIRSEALQLLLDDVCVGRLSDREALALHTRLTEMKMRLLGDRVSRWTAWRIAREHGWDTLRHAEYLAITKLQADALITVDPELAGMATGVVPLARLDDLLTK